MKRNSLRISVLVLPLLLAGVLFADLGRAGSLLFIGGVAAPVVSPVDAVTDLEWVLDPMNATQVNAANVTFDDELDIGSFVCVQVSSGPSVLLANGCELLTVIEPAGSQILVDFSTAGLGPTADAADIYAVNVSVTEPIVPTITGAAPVEIIDIQWELDPYDTSKVDEVIITFGPSPLAVGTPYSVFVALQDSDGLFLAQDELPLMLHAIDPTTITWDLSGAPVSAEAIVRFTIGFKPGQPWDLMAGIPEKLGHGAGMTTDGTNIYLIIGNRNRLLRYDPVQDQWTKSRELAGTPNNPNQGGALVYATDNGQNYLYALRGGAQDFWRYDIVNNHWDTMQPTPGDVKWGGSLTWDGGNYLYAFRGGDRPDFWRYDIINDNWESRSPAPQNVRDGGGLVFVNDGAAGGVYAMRGGSSLDFWRYDISSNTWDTGAANFPVPIGRGGAITSDGVDLLYALRGNDTKEIYRYSLTHPGDGWVIGPDIPLPMREGGSLVFLAGDVYATQGRQQSEFLRISPLPPF